MNILVADDDAVSIELLCHVLEQKGYSVTATRDGREAFELIRTGRYRMLITDWEMPNMDGLQLCEAIRRRQSDGYIYIILLTSYSGVDNVVRGLEAGADDFLVKPFQPQELLGRVRVGERIANLESRETTIFALAKLVESRDFETGGHLERMREYARILAEELSHHPDFSEEIDGQYIDLLYLTTPLHDIGKVAIPDSVLQKPGYLTTEEIEVMRTHTLLGAQTLREVSIVHASAGYLQMACDIALSHHEWWNGSGYPNHLSGEEIPLCGRITAIADVYDALTSKRAYKDAFTHEVACSLIGQGRGTQFDPRLVDAFHRCDHRFEHVKLALGEVAKLGLQLQPMTS